MAKVLFDGKREAERLAVFLEETERLLGKSLVIFQCDGRSEESVYVRLKREMGERLGVLVSVQIVKSVNELIEGVRGANEDETVDGILVQLPILNVAGEELENILGVINSDKDVDGLNPKSKFVPAAVLAVERLLELFKIGSEEKVAVVGARGSVGKRLIGHLETVGASVVGLDKGDDLNELRDFDVVISVTGNEGVIRPEMVKEGFTAIDLGFPRGDFSEEALNKASLATPVPGGVGPLTIVCLYENLAEV